MKGWFAVQEVTTTNQNDQGNDVSGVPQFLVLQLFWIYYIDNVTICMYSVCESSQ